MCLQDTNAPYFRVVKIAVFSQNHIHEVSGLQYKRLQSNARHKFIGTEVVRTFGRCDIRTDGRTKANLYPPSFSGTGIHNYSSETLTIVNKLCCTDQTPPSGLGLHYLRMSEIYVVLNLQLLHNLKYVYFISTFETFGRTLCKTRNCS